MSKSKKMLFNVILTAILIALNVILERLMGFMSLTQYISISVVTVAFAAVFLGVPYAVLVATLGDVAGALLFPTGAYQIGFTLTNALAGLIIGLFLYKKANILTITLGVITSKSICSLLLNSMLIAFLYRGGLDAFSLVLIPRIPAIAIMALVEAIVLNVVFNEKSPIRKSLSKVIRK